MALFSFACGWGSGQAPSVRQQVSATLPEARLPAGFTGYQNQILGFNSGWPQVGRRGREIRKVRASTTR
jgi:hypothetical protein